MPSVARVISRNMLLNHREGAGSPPATFPPEDRQQALRRNTQRTFCPSKGRRDTAIIPGDKSGPVTMVRLVVALRQAEEKKYLCRLAADLSTHHADIVRLCSLRMWVDVLIQDRKAHGGRSRMCRPQGVDGSGGGEPPAGVRQKPGMPAGCLIGHLKAGKPRWLPFAKWWPLMTRKRPRRPFPGLAEGTPYRTPGLMAVRDIGQQEPVEFLRAHARRWERPDAAGRLSGTEIGRIMVNQRVGKRCSPCSDSVQQWRKTYFWRGCADGTDQPGSSTIIAGFS